MVNDKLIIKLDHFALRYAYITMLVLAAVRHVGFMITF